MLELAFLFQCLSLDSKLETILILIYSHNNSFEIKKNNEVGNRFPLA